MKTPLIILLSLLLRSVASRSVDFDMLNTKGLSGNRLILNVNGKEQNHSAPFKYIMERSIGIPEDIKYILNVTQTTNEVHRFFTSTSPQNSQEKIEGDRNSELSHSLKIICTTKKNFCIPHGKLRRRRIPKWFVMHKSFLNKMCKNLKSKKKFEMEKNLLHAANSTTSQDSKIRLKRRCCRYHFKFYFKYFPVMQTYVGDLFQTIEQTLILSLILDLGFIMSFISLICFFVSMIISRRLREEAGNKILLHFCISIFVQIILHILICQFDMNSSTSKLASMTFQYFTLVEFVWTTVIAFIQYRRYVTVIYCTPNYSVLKISTTVYIISAVPIAARVIWDQCNIKFITYLTFTGPQLITLIINFMILIMISKNILCTKFWSPHQKRSVSVEAKVIFMLFLILDLGWIVAMLAFFTSNIIFAYIFIFSQSLQGFALFFIFIIINSHNRQILKVKWRHYVTQKAELKSSCKKQDVDPPSFEETI